MVNYQWNGCITLEEWKQITKSKCQIQENKIIQPEFTDIEELIKMLPHLSQENQKEMMKKKSLELKAYARHLESQKNKDANAYLMYLKILPFLPKDENTFAHISEIFDRTIFPNGIQDGGLYVISGIPGGGKTAICCMLTACQISGNNPFLSQSKTYPCRPVVYVSLEQEKQEIEMRIMSTLSALNHVEKAVSFSNLLNGKGWENPHDYQTAFLLFQMFQENLEVISCDEVGYNPNVITLLNKIENTAKKCDCTPLTIIDQYVNIDGTGDNVSNDVVMQIKNFAQRTKIPIIVQTQLTKQSIVSAFGKDGTLNNAKLNGASLVGTSSLNQQAIGTIILSETGKESIMFGERAKLVDINVKKMRYGSDTGCRMWYIGAYNLFLDYEEKRGRKKDEKSDIKGE